MLKIWIFFKTKPKEILKTNFQYLLFYLFIFLFIFDLHDSYNLYNDVFREYT